MRKDIAKWLQNPTVNPKATLGTALVWVCVLLGIHFMLPTRTIEARMVSPFLFSVRELLNRAPTLHPSIKIFGLDDVTVNALHRTDLDLTQWASVLEALDSKHPRAIVIDALFSVVDADKEVNGRKAIERIKVLKTPVYTGAYASPIRIYGRFALSLQGPKYELKTYLDESVTLPGTHQDWTDKLSIADYRRRLVYGSHLSMWDAFNKPGHILYGDDEGSYLPFLRLADGKTLPHVMLMPFEDSAFSQGELHVNGTRISLARDGSAPINFASISSVNNAVSPLIQLIDSSRIPKALEKIDTDSIIYIIPMFFTGNTDFKPSPVGLIPGGYAHLGVLNSILQKSNLEYLEIEPILIVGFAAAVAYFGWWMNPMTIIFTLLGTAVVWTLSCFGAFTYKGLILPFLLPQFSLFGVGVSLLLQRIYVTERKARMIRHALEGIVRPEALKSLQKNPERLSLEARERVITIMFIDIVGFSLMVENQLPRLAFESLQQLIEDMSLCIHRHGGIVNKTLGDGLLCFFGYSLEDNKETINHAEEALAAAAEIQKSNLPRIIASSRKREPVFPLRIGVNTAAVFMGNLGAGERLDITVIGNGVNFAKRLESACLPHSILVGPTTHELLRNKKAYGTVVKRLISIKHRDDMVESWEFDPLHEEPELRKQADEIYEASAAIHRLERRWAVIGEEKIAVISSFGRGDLVNFSSSGLNFVLPVMVARGTILDIQLDSVDGTLHRQLAKQGLQKIRVEVRWIHVEDKSYTHSVRFLDIDRRQSDEITELLCQFGSKQEEVPQAAS